MNAEQHEATHSKEKDNSGGVIFLLNRLPLFYHPQEDFCVMQSSFFSFFLLHIARNNNLFFYLQESQISFNLGKKL